MASPTPAQVIVLFWSEHSPNCAKLRQMMTEADLKLFEKVCIDSPIIRQAILDSLNLAIDIVPCFLILDRQGKPLAKHEGPAAFRWFQTFSRPGTRRPGPPPGPIGSPVEKILGGMRALANKPRGPPSMADPTFSAMPDPSGMRGPASTAYDPSGMRGPPLAGAQARGPTAVTRPRPQPDMGRAGRRPFQGLAAEPEWGQDDTHAMAGPVRPVRGEGHEHMLSSLSGFGQPEDAYEEHEATSSVARRAPPEEEDAPPRMVSVGRGRGAVMIEDLSAAAEPERDERDEVAVSFDEDPSGMSIPRGDVPIRGEPPKRSTNADEVTRQGSMGGRGKQKASAIKEQAAAMAAARSAEIETQNETRQGRAQPAKAKARGTPIKLTGH